MGLPNIGPVELIIVLVIALLILGPGKLPEVGSAFGKTIREFKKASSDITESTSPSPPRRLPRRRRCSIGTQHAGPGHHPQYALGRLRAGAEGHARRPGRRPRLSAHPEPAQGEGSSMRACPASSWVDIRG